MGQLHDEGAHAAGYGELTTWPAVAPGHLPNPKEQRVLDWTKALADELGIDLEVDVAAVLDLARDAAHNVARPAAPVTTFLVGYAAASSGGGKAAVSEMCRRASELATSWPAEDA
jgi:hypothetical protein